MSISDRLDEIAARCEATTPGPWDPGPLTVVFSTGTDAMVQTVAQTVSRADAEFIASARSDVPELVEAVRRRDAALRAVLDRHPKGTARAVGGTGGRDVEHCLGCRGARGIAHDDHGLVPWQCPTVRAVTAALGEES